MNNQFNFKCTDDQKAKIQERAGLFGFSSVSAYIKFVSINATIKVGVNNGNKEKTANR
jgi:hypothetical protein